MQKTLAALILTFLITLGTSSAKQNNVPEYWTQRLLPLPQKFELLNTVTVAPTALFATLETANAVDPIAQAALKDLTSVLANPSSALAFEIRLTLLSTDNQDFPELAQLLKQPNAEQGYFILPLTGDEQGLLIGAIDAAGLWNGTRTLRQLLLAGRGETDQAVPLVRIIDWPDFAERGAWNDPQDSWYQWRPLIKLNYFASTSIVEPFKRDKPASLKLRYPEVFEQCRLMGLAPIARISHLNFFERPGLLRVYPELAGRGDKALAGRYHAHKQGSMHRAPIPGSPILIDLISDMMRSLCAQGAKDISCWLTERPATDDSPKTLAVGQFVLEARAFLRAWETVRSEYPDLQIRLFLSTTTDERYHVICAEAPPEVKIVRACSTDAERIPCIPRDLFANPLLAQEARKGRWIGSYDAPLNSNGKVETPAFKLPHRSAHRIRDFVTQLHAQGYQGAAGMMAYRNFAREICGFNINALAEWSWNLKGRDTRAFALAWATLEGYQNPETVAAWAELMGPVEWDVYDSQLVEAYSQGHAFDMIRAKQMPVLGEDIFRYYTTPEAFTDKIKICDQALKLAEQIENPDFAHETRIIKSYIQLAQAIYLIAQRLASDDLRSLESQAELCLELETLAAVGKINTEAIYAWRAAYSQPPWHTRVSDAIAATERTVKEITDWLNHRYIY